MNPLADTNHRALFSAPIMGTARLDGWIACLTSPRSDLEAVLPGDLRLAGAATVAGCHPVVFICGTLTDTTILFGGLTIPTGVDYREFAVLIPFVHRSDEPDAYAFVLQMCSSAPTAVDVGNAYYGFAKRLASIERWDSMWLVTAPDGTLLAHALVETSDGPVTTRGSGGAGLDALRSALSLPLLGRKPGGTLVGSRFDWRLDEASVRRAGGWVSLAAPLVPGWQGLECGDVAGGMFLVRDLGWRLSWPSALRH